MKTVVVCMLSLAALVCAQDTKPEDKPKPEEMRKLGSVTWDLKAHKLVWVVQKGAEVDGKFVPSSEDRYEISPDDAVMAVANEKRGFAEEEATSLHHLLDVLSLYCAESVEWWDQGEGTPLDPDAIPAHPKKQPGNSDQPEKSGDKPTKVEQQPKNPPRPSVSKDALIANAGVR